MKPLSQLFCTLTVSLCLSISSPSQANPLYWDSDGDFNGNDPATGTGLGGSGNWDTTTSLWFDLVSNIPWNNVNSDDAILTGTSGTVTLTESISLKSLLFTNASGFTISESALNFGTNVALVNTGTGDQTINSTINGSGFTKAGTGALTLGGMNTYSNATTVSEGTLRLGVAGAIPDLSSVTIATNATFDLANFEETIGSLAGAGNVLMNAHLTTGSNNSSSTFSGVLDGAGNLIKIGTGTLTLSGTNLFSGYNIIQNGRLSVASDLHLGTVPGSVPDAIQIASNGILRATASFTLAPTRGITLLESGARMEVSSGQTLTFAGPIISTGVRLIKIGSGTLRETGNCFYSGLTIQSGTYRFSNEAFTLADNVPSQIGTYPTSVTPDYIILDGGTLRSDRAGSGSTFLGERRGITITANNGTINTSSSTIGDSTIYNGVISGPGALTKTGANELRLKINNTFSKLTVNQGLLRINGTGGGETGFGAVPATFTPDAITLNGGAIGTSISITLHTNRGITLGTNGGSFILSAGLTVPGVISGSGNLIRPSLGSSSQPLTLSGTNTYTGKTMINNGQIYIPRDAGLGAVPTNFVADAITLNGTNATLRSTATFTLNANRGITIGPGDAIMEQTSGTLTYNGIITGTPTNGIFIKSGSATLQLGGANTYVATTRLSGGTLSLNRSDAIGTGLFDIFGNGVSVRAASGTARSLTNAIKFTTSGFNLAGAGGLTFSGDVNLGGSPTAITNNNTAAAGTTFSGALTNVGGVTIETTNAQNAIIVTGDNSYTGATTVNGGRLFVSNISGSGTGSGAVTVSGNGTLGGTGTIAGNVTINSKITAGGHLAGSSIGTLTLQNGLAMTAATNAWELGALKDDTDGVAGTDFDQIVLTGGNLAMSSTILSLHFTNAASAPDFANTFWQTTHKWTIIRMNGGANADNFAAVEPVYHAGVFTTAVEANGDISLTFTPAGPTGAILVADVQSKSVVQSSNATFTVSATGTAPLGYQWYYNNAPVSFGTSSALTITNSQPINEGPYFVVASNNFGAVTSSIATLTVLIPPSISVQPEGKSVEPGTNVTFSVTASGTAPLTYQWKLNGINITGATTNTYEIASITTNSVGNYSVAITNAAGFVISGNAALTIGEPPAPILSISVTNNDVTLSWTSETSRVYRPQFKSNLNATNWTDIAPDVTATGATSSITNNVSSQTERYYRVLRLP